jgi:sterol desaturase/sphingolipid hydroxylase (fatty acid hydroxylase superfamily)
MHPEIVRSAAFVAGLLTFLSWEVVAPDHADTAPKGRRIATNLSLAILNGAVIGALWGLSAELALRPNAPWRLRVFSAMAVWPIARVVAEVLLLDLVQYWLHRLYHLQPFFWRFHRIHHTDLDLDASSASRFHLGEVGTSAVAKLAVVATLGVSPAGLLAFEVTLLVCAQFQHANIRLPRFIESALWWIVVPPAMHRVHHRPDVADTNSNYGTILTLWDRLFGSLRATALVNDAFGLAEFRRFDRLSLPRLLKLPFEGRSSSVES